MTAVVLIGVMADRATLTMRTIAVAALAVMLIVPEAVIHPSFQMSFAATLALIATYERGIPVDSDRARNATRCAHCLMGRAGNHGAGDCLAGRRARHHALRRLSLSSHGALRGHRNLLAMPIISALSMPAGL